ncbi:MAG TPA: metallophosphoesterase [Syntrophales bacterium]|nr:metallophosphoesterase [Syntrophales bacterium]HPI57458.1 metallophosphoesterase [Syntrophales bacterium]HPN25685.1 metallophosphoesterase [Syntrophales bacterium]HQM29483.1 metallophosphoesterase [Syntrophales bacterium]
MPPRKASVPGAWSRRPLQILPALLAILLLSAADGFLSPVTAGGNPYHHIVVFSDLHLPGRNLEAKEKAVENVNSWSDVDSVVILGDICDRKGSEEEYAFAKEFLSRLKKPFYPVTGNHDYLYEQDSFVEGKRKGFTEERAIKLNRFKETFGLKEIYYSKKLRHYLLVFLSVDSLYSNYHAAMSQKQLEWFEAELEANKTTPTIVFYHAPLKGTLTGSNIVALFNHFFAAQPAGEIKRIINRNPQVFMWVSGHIHTAPENINYVHNVNLYEGRVLNVHNTDMDGRSFVSHAGLGVGAHDNIWTNSFFLYPNRVVIKTYDQKKGYWLEEKTREVRTPVFVKKGARGGTASLSGPR